MIEFVNDNGQDTANWYTPSDRRPAGYYLWDETPPCMWHGPYTTKQAAEAAAANL